MKYVALVARILLGLVFVVFGLNIFLHFIPTPSPAGDPGNLMMLMFQHGWFKLIGSLEILGGLMLLIGRYVPLGLTILAPLLVNIVLFHATLAPAGLPFALFWAMMEIYLIYAYWQAFAGLLRANAKPFEGAFRNAFRD
jgi:putative oxidoreductase